MKIPMDNILEDFISNNINYGNGINGLVVHKTDNAVVTNNLAYVNGAVPTDAELDDIANDTNAPAWKKALKVEDRIHQELLFILQQMLNYIITLRGQSFQMNGHFKHLAQLAIGKKTKFNWKW